MRRAILLGALRMPKVIRACTAPLGWRRLTIGFGIGSESLRVVGVSGGSVRWTSELQRQDGVSLAASLGKLLSQSPLQKQRRRRWMRPRAVVAIGPSLVQVKKLSGLPPLRDSAALSAVIREGAGRFFLKNGIPLLTTDVTLIDPGTGWAAAFEAPAVEQVQRACIDAGLALRAIVPAAVALGQVATSGELTWTDGYVQAQLAYRDRKLVASRQLHVPKRDDESADPKAPPFSDPALEMRGDDAMRYADAYGATRIARGDPMVLSIGNASRISAVSRTRIRIAASMFGVSVLAALAMPPLLATRSTARARTRLALIAPEARKARGIASDLDKVSNTLRQVSEFASEGSSVTVLLERITASLPEHAAIVSLEVDSSRGTMVALAPRASQITDALERVSGVGSPQVVGPIIPTTTRAGVVERVTVRFWLVPQARTESADSVGNPASVSMKASPPEVDAASTSRSGASR